MEIFGVLQRQQITADDAAKGLSCSPVDLCDGRVFFGISVYCFYSSICFIYTFTHSSVSLSIYMFFTYLSTYTSIVLSVCQSISLFLYLFIRLCMCIYIFVYVCVYLSIYLHIYLFIFKEHTTSTLKTDAPYTRNNYTAYTQND